MLLAPLAKEAGGWGLCRMSEAVALRSERGSPDPQQPLDAKNATSSSSGLAPVLTAAARESRAPTAAVFASTADPGYQAIRAMIIAGREFLERGSTRFDMTNFKPRPDWVREMKRYGVLPECVKPGEVTDAYAVEQDYWKSLWHQPAVPTQAQNKQVP